MLGIDQGPVTVVLLLHGVRVCIMLHGFLVTGSMVTEKEKT